MTSQNRQSTKVEGLPHPVDIHIGLRLKELRRAKQLTQIELAQLLGISNQLMHRYEAGKTSLTSRRLYELSGALNVAVGHFFDGLKSNSQREPTDHVSTPDPILEQVPKLPKGAIRTAFIKLIKEVALDTNNTKAIGTEGPPDT